MVVALSLGRLRAWRRALSGLALTGLVACNSDPLKQTKPRILWTFSDPACDQQCDAYGNCSFPTGACGTQSCDGGTNELSAQICNGDGGCAVYAPAPCPGNLACADTASCLASCAKPADCVAGYTCKNGNCVPAN